MREWTPYGIRTLFIVALFFSSTASSNQWVISKPVEISANKPAAFEVVIPVLIKKQANKTKLKVVTKSLSVETLLSKSRYSLSDSPEGINTGGYYFEDDEDIESLQEFKNWKGWFKPLYDSGNRNEVSGVLGFSTKTAGFAVGADAEMSGKTRVGTALTFDKTSINGDDKRDTKQRTILGSFYTHWDNRLAFFDTVMTLGRSYADTSQMTDGFKYEGDFQASIWAVSATAGRHFRYKGWNIDPMAMLNYSSVSFDDYLEKTSAGQVKKIKPTHFEATEFGLGLKLNRSYWGRTLVRRGKYKPEFSLMGFYDINSSGSNVKSRFATGYDSFVITSPKRDKFRLKGELGVTVNTYRRWTFQAGYRFHWSSNFNSHGVSAKADYRF